MVSKKNDTSWIASGLRDDGAGVMAVVEVEAVAAAAGATTTAAVAAGLGVAGSLSDAAALGGSTLSALSVVGLLGWIVAGLNSPDTRDSGVSGSEAKPKTISKHV